MTVFVTQQDLINAFGAEQVQRCFEETGTNPEEVLNNINQEITFLVSDLSQYTTEERSFIKNGLKSACLDLARFRIFATAISEEMATRGRGALKYFNDIKAGKIHLLPVRKDATDYNDDTTVSSGNVIFGNLRKERLTDFTTSGIEIW